MNLKRDEKERLYISKMTELQRHWQNPIDGDWDYVKDFTDEELDKSIEDTIGQLSFEKKQRAIIKFSSLVVTWFLYLGIFGLLLFGVKQLFW